MGEVTGGEQPKPFPPILDGAGARAVRIYGRDDVAERPETEDVLLRADTAIAGLRTSTFIDDRQAVGRCYIANYDAEAVANNAFIDVLFLTPIEIFATIWFDIGSIGDARFEFFENANPAGGNGTVVPITNLNRWFATERPPRARSFHTPDFTGGDTGTRLVRRELIGGERGKSSIINQRNIGQFILLPNVWYLIRLTNTSGSASDLSIQFAHVEALSGQTSEAQQQGIASARAAYSDPDPFGSLP